MDRTQTTNATAGHLSGSGMTRDEILAFFQRRQEPYDDFEGAALARDYALDAAIESPFGGVHVGPAAAEQTMYTLFQAFLDRKMTFKKLLIDGNDALRETYL